MPLIIDSHAHVFPDLRKREWTEGKLGKLRERAKVLWKPVSKSMHAAQTVIRHLPEKTRNRLDALSGVAPLAGLLIESIPEDLLASMNESAVDFTVVIAHPPLITNDFIMELCAKNPRLIPVVNIPKGTPKPATHFRALAKKGAKALKIHASADGDPITTPRYRSLVKAASDLGLPVIIHTGCVHSKVLYKDPDMGRAELFVPWFKEYPKTRFILAHMNFHDPEMAMDLAETHANLYLETSWQPAEVIGESVRRVGADRVLFGSDWPFVGSNTKVGLSRIRDGVETGAMTENQAKLILGQNAAEIFGVQPHAP